MNEVEAQRNFPFKTIRRLIAQKIDIEMFIRIFILRLK